MQVFEERYCKHVENLFHYQMIKKEEDNKKRKILIQTIKNSLNKNKNSQYGAVKTPIVELRPISEESVE